LEEEGFVITVHGKGTYVSATDKQLAMEARRKTVEDDFAAAVENARAVGLTNEDILEIVQIILEEN
jgi:GntR family transcriptional regulator